MALDFSMRFESPSAQLIGIFLNAGIGKNKRAPKTLKNRCTSAIDRPAIFPVRAASNAVAVVPMFAPIVIGYIACRLSSPDPAIGIKSEVVIELD